MDKLQTSTLRKILWSNTVFLGLVVVVLLILTPAIGILFGASYAANMVVLFNLVRRTDDSG